MMPCAVAVRWVVKASRREMLPRRGAWDLTREPTLLWFFALHVALGALMSVWLSTATVHAWATVAGSLWIALSANQREHLAGAAAYVMGAEVLWRMGHAEIFWETGKYAVVVLLLIGLARFPRSRSGELALGYFVLLVPGIFVAAWGVTDAGTLRNAVSFNLSDSLCLAVSAYFFRQVLLSNERLSQLALLALGPVIAMVTRAIIATGTSTDLVFTRESNVTTSAGFGPNQVASVLGLGAVFCFLLLSTQPGLRARIRAVLLLVLLVCTAQSAMTFSRGGLYAETLAMLAGSLCLVAQGQYLRRVLIAVVVVGAASIMVAPQLNRFTDGALLARFQERNVTHRGDIAQLDFGAWQANPWLGQGVGQGGFARSLDGFTSVAPHNLWTRLLAEHGVFGLGALLLLVAMMCGAFLRARGTAERAVVATLLVWSTSFFTINASRIAAPSFLIGLACAPLCLDRDDRPTMKRWRRLKP